MAAENGLRVIRQYSDEGRNLASRVFQESTRTDLFVDNARNVLRNLVQVMHRLKQAALDTVDPAFFIEQLSIIYRDEISRNNIFFVSVGLGIGTVGGFVLGFWLARPHLISPVMKSISCISFSNDDNVTLTTTAIPRLRSSCDVLVRVRSASINRVDRLISQGYGRYLRRLLQKYDQNDSELPLTIGRACSGIVEGVGKGCKSGLEIGDEVWLATPFYENGVCSEIVVAPEGRIGRKPYIIGFEGAASLPYSGCIALTALNEAGLNEHTCFQKRVLIQDGCSPVGCVLTQLVHKWGAHVTATCHTRSMPVVKALGADEVITVDIKEPESDADSIDINDSLPSASNIRKQLALRNRFDVIFMTTTDTYPCSVMEQFIVPQGVIINTVEADIASDNFGLLMRCAYSVYVRLKSLAYSVVRAKPDWGGPHLCHLALDQLAGYVNDNVLQTVVDKVYTVQGSERALDHICSENAIGNTIVTFR